MCRWPSLITGRIQEPSPPTASVCSRGAQYPQRCWKQDHSRSHEQDRQGTRQGCQTELSKLGTRLELLGGTRSWEEAPSLLEEGRGRALGCCHWHLHSPISGFWRFHFDEPPENDLNPAASLFTYLPRPFTPRVTRGCLAARSNQAGQEVRAGGGFPFLPLLTSSLGEQAGWGGEQVPQYSLAFSPATTSLPAPRWEPASVPQKRGCGRPRFT